MSDRSLAGKTVLITGGARRVGAAIAREAAWRGRQPRRSTTASRRTTRNRLAAELNAARAAAPRSPSQADLLDLGKAASARGIRGAQLRRARRAGEQRVDVLPHAGGRDHARGLGRSDRHAISRRRCFCRRRRRRRCSKSGGLIINIVDIHALRPLRNYTVYCTAKAGLHMLTRSLAKELGPEIRVNGIAPGPVLWPERRDDAARAKIIQRTILKRMGTPADIARTALFFAAHAPFITGQILAVDGGRSVAW